MSILRRSVPAVLLAAAVFFLVPTRAAEPDPAVLSFTLPDKIPWTYGDAQDTAILQGDPSKPGIYIEMLRWKAGNMSRPHSHSTARYITVLEGTWWLGWGPNYDPDSTFPVTKGSFIVHHPNQLHYDGAKDEDAVLLIVGMGPVETRR